MSKQIPRFKVTKFKASDKQIKIQKERERKPDTETLLAFYCLQLTSPRGYKT